MKNYCARLIENVVTEIIVGEFAWVEQNLDGDWHDLGGEPLNIAIGWVYNSKTNSFAPPPKPDPLPNNGA